MTDPVQPATTPPSTPRIIGRLTTRILVAGLGLSFADVVLQLARDSDAFLWGVLGMAGFGLLLTALPSVLFLVSSWRPDPPMIDRRGRLAIYVTGGLMAFGGALYATASREDVTLVGAVLGAVFALLGVTAIVRLFLFRSPPGAAARLAGGNPAALGALAFIIVVVMLPKFACGCGNKSKAYRAQLKMDLRNVVLAEEAYFADNHRYATVAEMGSNFAATSNDSIVVTPVDSQGYRATGTHYYLTGVTCGIWAGVRPADGMHGAKEGEPICWEEK